MQITYSIVTLAEKNKMANRYFVLISTVTDSIITRAI